MRSLFFLILSVATAAHIYPSPSDTLRFGGTVTYKFEIWDRAGNPMMGRPDELKEIILAVRCDSVIGESLSAGDTVRLRVRGAQRLIHYKSIVTGQRGLFKVLATGSVNILFSFVPLAPPPDANDNPGNDRPSQVQDRKSLNEYMKMSGEEFLKASENIPGKLIISSDSLQQRAAQLIGKKYRMKHPAFVSCTSFRGPAPPPGGYVYWGIRGMKDGKWYVWQPGRNGKLREGREVVDPKRYSK